MTILLAALAGLALPGAVQDPLTVSGGFIYVGLSRDSVVSGAHFQRLEPGSTSVERTTWEWTVLREPARDPTHGAIDTLATRVRIDCAARSYRPDLMVVYVEGVERTRTPVPHPAQTPAADSIRGRVVANACADTPVASSHADLAAATAAARRLFASEQ